MENATEESNLKQTSITEPSEESTTQTSSTKDAAARREARRRRIMENSNNRLSKITGREHNEPPLEPTALPIIYPDPEMERDTLESHEHFTLGSEPPQDVLEMLRELRQQSGGGMPGTETETKPKEPPTKFMKILSNKIHYFIMGAIIAILFATNNEWMVGNRVFLPLLCWEIIEVFLLKTYESKINFLGIIFVFLGVDQRWVQIITKIIETINKLFKDFSCFTWAFVMTHIFWGSVIQQKDWNDLLYLSVKDGE